MKFSPAESDIQKISNLKQDKKKNRERDHVHLNNIINHTKFDKEIYIDVIIIQKLNNKCN